MEAGTVQRTGALPERLFTPPSAAADPEWLTLTAWQGGDKVVNHLKRIGPGRYRATEPLQRDAVQEAAAKRLVPT